MSDIVNKLWGFCHTLRHDGIDYGDYIEQLTYLLFLKMAEERAAAVPKGYDWASLKNLSGTALTDHYADILRKLREAGGLLADIFAQATPRFNNPVNLKRVIAMIDEEDWSAMDVDVKGAAFEGLLEKAASEGKKGAGQYFTPRVLIKSIVRVMKPDPRGKPEFTIADPACGTGGFLVCSYEWLIDQAKGVFDRADAKRIKTQTYFGQDLVPRPRRLALMNLFLHGVEPHIYLGDTIYDPFRGEKNDVILTNPPFGTRGANQAPEREDFTIETSNKQLNFLQHVLTALKPGGRAAMVLPDNCLFEGKAGEVFEILMQDCNLHTILRLPRGTFTPYSQGVRANVIFFEKGPPTEKTWIFDARSNVPGITKKDRPLTPHHFAQFEKAYGPDPNGRSRRTEAERFRCFGLDEIKKREYKLDITWLKDESLEDGDEASEPQDLATEAIADLNSVVDDLRDLQALEQAPDNDGGLPKGWASCRVREVFHSFGGGTPNKQTPAYWGGKIPWLSSGDIKAAVIGGASETITKAGLENSSASLCRPESVLVVVRSGILKHTLPVAVLKVEAAINQDIKCFDSDNEELNHWLALALRASAREILALNREGTTVQSVKYETLTEFELPVPPLPEQRRIREKLDILYTKLNASRARLESVAGYQPQGRHSIIERLAQSLLAKAFRGELVPQDPNDEPASVLLEKIRQTKTNDQLKRKTKGAALAAV